MIDDKLISEIVRIRGEVEEAEEIVTILHPSKALPLRRILCEAEEHLTNAAIKINTVLEKMR